MSGYNVQLERVTPQPTVVVRRQVQLQQLAGVIREASGEVWDFVTRMNARDVAGRNVVLYLDQAMNLEVGVEIGADIEAQPPIFPSRLPGGLVAATVHTGPYERLSVAHRAILDWCEHNDKPLAGPYWEIYDHWNDDPAQLRTFVHYLLHER